MKTLNHELIIINKSVLAKTIFGIDYNRNRAISKNYRLVRPEIQRNFLLLFQNDPMFLKK